MILNHLNLTVADVPATCDFLEKYFGLHNMGGNAGLTVMSDERGFVLTLMKAGKSSPLQYPDNFHIGFFIESEAKDVQPPERHHAYGFYVEAPGGFSVEIGA